MSFRRRESLGRVRIWGASMGFLRVFCGALTTRLRGFCGVSLTWRVLLLFSVDVKCLFRYDRDMADRVVCILGLPGGSAGGADVCILDLPGGSAGGAVV